MTASLHSPLWHEVLLAIRKSPERERYSERLNRRVQISLTRVRDLVKLLAIHDLVRFKPTKKIKYIELTEKGVRVSSLLFEMRSELGSLSD